MRVLQQLRVVVVLLFRLWFCPRLFPYFIVCRLLLLLFPVLLLLR